MQRLCCCWITYFHPVLSTDICLHVGYWWPGRRPSSGLCQVVLWWLQPGASSTSRSPLTRERSTLKDVLLGMFPTKLDMVHDLFLFLIFIEAHDYFSPSVLANVVYVTGHGNNNWCQLSRYLGLLEYGSVPVTHLITSYLGTAFEAWDFRAEGSVQISCPTEFSSSSNTVRAHILNFMNLSALCEVCSIVMQVCSINAFLDKLIWPMTYWQQPKQITWVLLNNYLKRTT